MTKLTAKASAAIFEGYKTQVDISPTAVHTFLAKHAKWERSTGLWTVHTPMRAYKQTRTMDGYAALVVLEVPAGALVFAPTRDVMIDIEASGHADASDRKMRVSEAKVVAQYSLAGLNSGWYARNNPSDYRDGKPVKRSFSDHSSSFEYKTGTVAKPREPFSMEREQCESGIHVFLNAADATAYDFT